jgi:hypothetical protein
MHNSELQFAKGYLRSLEDTTERLCRWQSLMEDNRNKDMISLILDVMFEEIDNHRHQLYKLEEASASAPSQNPQRSLLLD